MVLRMVISVLTLVATSLLGVASANAKVFYISGSSNRTSGGSSCSDALSVAWFNNSASWGSASHQISAGTTVYLCGVFNGRPGEKLLTVRGSGASGSPITIKFLPGTVLSAPYWSSNGAIHMDGVSHIVVDGGTNGVIQNTANGTGRVYRQRSVAIHANGCDSCTVQNLTIQNLYVRTSATDLAATHTVSCVAWHLANNLTVSHITCHDASWAVAGDGNNFTLENSDLYSVDHGVASGAYGKAGGYSIHNNHFHDFANWDSPSDTYHHDGVHLWGQHGGTITSGAIYNNTFDGDFGVNITAHIFLQDSVQHVAVYNNICMAPAHRTLNSVWITATSISMPGGPAIGNSAYNNSINAGGHRSGSGIFADNQLEFTAVNNILSGGQSDITIQGGTTLTSAGVNNNVYHDLFAMAGDRNTFGWNGANSYVLSKWQRACRCDSASKLIVGALSTFASVTGSAGTAVAQVAFASSPVDAVAASNSDGTASGAVNLSLISTAATADPELELLATVGEGNGLNLSDLAVDDLAPLAFDKNGAPRPASGPWNVGPF
jgi:hypothetical protein